MTLTARPTRTFEDVFTRLDALDANLALAVKELRALRMDLSAALHDHTTSITTGEHHV